MRSPSSEKIECPLCCGVGELTRAEVLDRLGVKDFARVAQLSAEEAFRLLQTKHNHEHQSGWARFETELARRTAEIREQHKDELRLALSERENLSRRVEDCLRELAELRERNQELEGEMSKAARIGKREEMSFEEEARTWAGICISEKLPRNGDFILAYRAPAQTPPLRRKHSRVFCVAPKHAQFQDQSKAQRARNTDAGPSGAELAY